MSEGRLELVVAVQCHLKRNLGPLIRCATVFGASLLVVVGSKRFGTHGAHGSDLRLRVVHFFTWPEAYDFLIARCAKGLFYAICEKALPDKKSQKLESTSFVDLDSVYAPAEPGMVTFCVGAHNGEVSDDILSVTGAQAIHVEFLVPDIIDRLRFENMFSIVLDFYVSKVVSRSAVPGRAFQCVSFDGEKFTVSETLKSVRTPDLFVEQVAAVKKAHRADQAEAFARDFDDDCMGGLFDQVEVEEEGGDEV